MRTILIFAAVILVVTMRTVLATDAIAPPMITIQVDSRNRALEHDNSDPDGQSFNDLGPLSRTKLIGNGTIEIDSAAKPGYPAHSYTINFGDNPTANKMAQVFKESMEKPASRYQILLKKRQWTDEDGTVEQTDPQGTAYSPQQVSIKDYKTGDTLTVSEFSDQVSLSKQGQPLFFDASNVGSSGKASAPAPNEQGLPQISNRGNSGKTSQNTAGASIPTEAASGAVDNLSKIATPGF